MHGNLNNESGTGVAFTRDPATGENKLMGEFLINAQGEDVVAGVDVYKRQEEYGLFKAGDSTGHFCKLQECSENFPQEDPVWNRPGWKRCV